MKSLKERLEEKIESNAWRYDTRVGGSCHMPSYKAGAASLVPLVVELANELQLIAIQKTKDEYESDEDNDIWDFVCASEAYEITILKSRKAFQSIEKLMGDK